jgi:hypothetical protein
MRARLEERRELWSEGKESGGRESLGFSGCGESTEQRRATSPVDVRRGCAPVR